MAGGLTGSLEQWPLPELLNMLGSSRQSGRVEIDDDRLQGSVFLQEGNVVHAIAPAETGVAALTSLFGLESGTFTFEPRVPSPAVTLSRPLDALIAEVTREANERETIRKVIASASMLPRLSPELPAEPITLQPNEWMLIAASNGASSIEEIIARLELEPGPVMRAYYALAQRGLVRFEAKADLPEPGEKDESPALPFAGPAPAPTLTLMPNAAPRPVANEPTPLPATPTVPEPLHAEEAVFAPREELPAPTPLPVPLVSQQFFRELARASAAALGPLASVIVEDAVEAHGATIDAFPRSRAGYLVEAIAREIKDDRRRAEFQAHMLRLLRELHSAA